MESGNQDEGFKDINVYFKYHLIWNGGLECSFGQFWHRKVFEKKFTKIQELKYAISFGG